MNIFKDGSCSRMPWRPEHIARPNIRSIANSKLDIANIKVNDLNMPGEKYKGWSVSMWEKAARITVDGYLKQWVHWECFMDKVLYDRYLPLSVKRAITNRVSLKFDSKPNALKRIPDKYVINYILALAQVNIDIDGAIEIFNYVQNSLSSEDYIYITYIFGLSYLVKKPKDRNSGLFWMMKSAGAANGENVTDPGMDMSSLASAAWERQLKRHVEYR